ncbi:hypothetical protein N7539_001190 [Penicillium diatomitis]|uniref:Serine aminopeptidase S33 domain-containing protein n=1 Tax=Penicillium diatomitis TaxID=2819901 RepID=A0A9X0C3F4_9EURO|nr:uncharacterized protein N7539_001190 [Penicillium diatomitis]KAJ5496074.1 hypothetical protein N7539_001190 [Penicillium diatomitis]
MSVEEGSHTLPDETELYTKTWKSEGSPKAILALVHGFSDHCNAYYDLFPTLASNGIEVRAFDQRGWGRSFKGRKDRGNSGGTALVLSDLHSFLRAIPVPPNVPLFVMGHSMGGGEVLNYVLHPDSPYNQSTARPQLAGVLCYSPLIALDPATRPMAFTVIMGRLVARVLPKWQRYSPLDGSLICRDEQVVKDYTSDELCHNTGTLEQLAGMLDRGIWLEKLKEEDLKNTEVLPMWFGHGNGDRITSWDATKKLASVLEKKGDVTFVTYEGGYHRVHMDPGETREQFSKDVSDWVLKQASTYSQPQPEAEPQPVPE